MAAIIIVRDMDGNKPSLPDGYDCLEECDNWLSVWPLGRTERPDVFIHAELKVVHTPSNRGCFVIRGTPAILRNIYTVSPHAWTRAQLLADSGAMATYIKANWPDDRHRKTNGDLLDPSEPLVHQRNTVFGVDARQELINTSELP